MANDITFAIPATTTKLIQKSTLAVMSANERGIPQKMRALAYKKEFDEKLSPSSGGKNAWDTFLEKLADKIGFAVPGSARFTIQDIWAKFIGANRALVDEGNNLIKSDLAAHGKVSNETIEKLRELSLRFIFPKELELLIRNRTEELKGWVIARSSGRHEDSYLRNLAGIFISPRKRDERLVVKGVKEIFAHALGKIWITENEKETKTEGIPNLLTAEEGFGILVQPFLQFEASGTAMTNRYGHTSIEAVIGDAEMAVRGVRANVGQFLFKNNDPAHFEYNPSFLTFPYQVRLKGDEYCLDNDFAMIREIARLYPQIDGKLSPISEEEARELYRVVNALEKEIGVPLDVEWGFLGGKLYIIQIRPDIGDFKEPLVEMSPKLKSEAPVASTPIALGHTKPEGVTGRMVAFSKGVTQEAIARFENEYGEDYIRVQSDVASAVLDTKTRAKVLVDPEQGSRQAHNINLISKRIKDDEFVYCNGPILRDGLLRSLHFSPHPTIEGVWISEEDITYFCDGLRGGFYKRSPREQTLPNTFPDNENMRQIKDFFDNIYARLISGSMPSTMNKKDAAREIARDIASSIGGPILKYTTWGLIKNKTLMEEVLGEIKYCESNSGLSLAKCLRRLEALETTLDFPLWPDEWDMGWLGVLRKITGFIGDYRRFEKERGFKTKLPRADVFRAILYDEHNAYYKIEDELSRGDDSDVVRFSSGNRHLFGQKLAEWDYDADFVLIHMAGYRNYRKVVEVVENVRIRNPSAFIIVASLNIEQLKDLERDHGVILIEDRGEFFNNVAKLAKECHARWLEAHKKPQPTPSNLQAAPEPQAALAKPEKPEKPKKLKVLIAGDEVSDSYRMDFENALGTDEYEFYFAKHYVEAFRILWLNDIDAVESDWMMPDRHTTDFDDETMAKITGDKPLPFDMQDSSFSDLFLNQLQKVPNIRIATLGDINKIRKKILIKAGKDVWKRIHYAPIAGLDATTIGYELKEWRQDQIEAYDKALAEWQRAQAALQPSAQLTSPVKPEKPGRLTVLCVEDEATAADQMMKLFEEAFDVENYNFLIAQSASEGIKSLEENKVDFIIADLMSLDTKLGTAVSSVPRITIFSGYPDEKDIAEKARDKMSGETLARTSILSKNKPEWVGQILESIKQVRHDQVKAYEKALVEWQAAQTAPQPSAQGTAPVKLEKLRVLYLEDEVAFRNATMLLFNQTFDKNEYIFTSVRNTREAVEALKGNQYDVVIFDVGVPGSREFQDSIRSIPHPIILTGYLIEEVQRRVANDIFSKAKYFCKGDKYHEEFYELIKGYRQEQIKAYERSLTEWQRAQAALQLSAQLTSPAKPEKLKVLFIDDDKMLTDNVEIFVKAEFPECELTIANDVDNASGELDKGRYDMIFFDLKFPSIGEVTERLKRTDAKLIVVSGCLESAIKKNSLINDTILNRVSEFLNVPFQLSDDLAPILKRAREEQIQGYEKSLAGWQKAQASVLVTTPEPAKPGKLNILCVDDEADSVYRIKNFLEDQLAPDEYNLICVISQSGAVEALSKERFDYVITDWRMPGTVSGHSVNVASGVIDAAVANGVKYIDINSAANEYIFQALEYIQRASSNVDGRPLPPSEEEIVTRIKEIRQKKLKTYEKALTEWQAAQPKKGPAAVAKGDTIFVVGTNSAEIPALARFIARQRGPEYKVQNYVDFISDEPVPFRIIALTDKADMYTLQGSLKRATPDIVIADTHLDGIDRAQDIMRLVLEKNSQAKIIFTSEEAAITETQPKGDNVLAVLEKSFHFHDVMDVLNGTYADKILAAGVRFKIEESAKLINSVEKAHTIDKPGIIRIWQGYAAPQFQESMLTRIRTKTEKGPYQIGFDKDINDLVNFACREGKNDNVVTILPSKLTDGQKKRLELAGAHVIFIDLKDGVELGTDDIVQLGTIVFTGIAYLNNNDNALMRLHRLLTGDKHVPITVEKLKKNPNLLVFIFEPAAIHNYDELKHLNDLMEEHILKAA